MYANALTLLKKNVSYSALFPFPKKKKKLQQEQLGNTRAFNEVLQ